MIYFINNMLYFKEILDCTDWSSGSKSSWIHGARIRSFLRLRVVRGDDGPTAVFSCVVTAPAAKREKRARRRGECTGAEKSEATIETMSGNDRGPHVAFHKWTVASSSLLFQCRCPASRSSFFWTVAIYFSSSIRVKSATREKVALDSR